MFKRKFIDRLRDKYQSGGVKYNTMDKVQDALTVGGLTPGFGIIPDAVNTVISAGRAGYNFLTGDTERAKSQAGDLALNAASMIPIAGHAAGAAKIAKTANKLQKSMKVAKKGKAAYNVSGAAGAMDGLFSNPTTPYRLNVNQTNQAPASIPFKSTTNVAKTGGMYKQMQQYQAGGVALPGGVVEPIPGSDAVEFKGQTHDEGGIMMDPQTEVENGETMDQVTMAKKGGKRDYFFSSYLKEGGRSYADMHKNILANGGSQKEINMLAKMQEAAAGRNPQQVAKLGGMAEYQSGGYYLGQDVENPADNFQLPQNDPFAVINQPAPVVTSLKDQAEKDAAEALLNNYTVDTPEQQLYADELKSLEEMKKIEAEEYSDLYDKAAKKAAKGRGTPGLAYAGMGAQLVPAAYAFLHKQKKPDEASFTPGFTSPVQAQSVRAQKLDRVNYNDKRSQLASSIRGAMKQIETSGGGPGNMANMQATLAKDIMGQMQINAAETKANIAIDNQEKQLSQQAALDNVKRRQAASEFNAQMARGEAARKDQINAANVAIRNQFEADQEMNKMNALSNLAQGIAGGTGDILSYKATERMAEAMGAEGIYQRDIMRDFVTKRAEKDGIPGLCESGECTQEQINSYIANKGVYKAADDTKEAKMGGMYKYHAGGLYHNINHKKKSGTSKSKKNSTISSKAWKNMKAGFPK